MAAKTLLYRNARLPLEQRVQDLLEPGEIVLLAGPESAQFNVALAP